MAVNFEAATVLGLTKEEFLVRSTFRCLLLAFLAVTCLSLTACKYRSKNDTYYLVAANGKLPYWKAVGDGFNTAARQYGVTARIVGPEGYDPAAEASAFSDAVAAHPAGILVSASEASVLQGDINSAIGAGVPVITVDSDAPNSRRLYFIGTNNLEVGHLGGRRLLDRLNGKGNIVFFSIPGQPNLEDRLKGYKEVFADKPGIKILDVVATGGESGSAFDKAEQYAQQTGANKVDAFVCLESESGKAVAEVLKRGNPNKIMIIAMDVDPDTLSLIKSGAIDSTVSQKPWSMGYVGLKQLDEAHRSQKGEFRSNYSVDFRSPYPAFVDTGSALITQDNVAIYEYHAQDE